MSRKKLTDEQREQRQIQKRERWREYQRTHKDRRQETAVVRARLVVAQYEQREGKPAANDPLLVPGYRGHRYANDEQREYYKAKRLVLKYTNGAAANESW